MAAAIQDSMMARHRRDQGNGTMDQLVTSRTNVLLATNALLPEVAIIRRIERALRQSGYSAHRDVSCVALGQALYLRGCLPTYHLKQVAQELVARVAGAHRVINCIEIVPAPTQQPRAGFHWPREHSASSGHGQHETASPIGEDGPSPCARRESLKCWF
jgi:hypothetical protein